MLRKLFILLCCIPFTLFTKWYCFFDGDLWVDIYSSIDKWLTKAEARTYEYELTDQWNKKLHEELNRILKNRWLKECLVTWISLSDLWKIQAWDIETMSKTLKPECLNEKGEAPLELSNQYMTNIKWVLSRVKAKSEEKTKKMYEISRIGLYSDGDKNNSPFDLIEDIREIEKIIFTQNLEYKGVITNLDKDFDDLMSWVFNDKKKTGSWGTGTWNDDDGNGGTGSGTWVYKKKYTPFITLTKSWSYVCSDSSLSIETSGLSEETIKELLYGSWSSTSSSSSSSSWWSGTWWQSHTWIYDKFPSSAYSKINDNALWPCNEFFCIKIEFVIKNYNLLTWWKTVSIESLLKKSNEHLKKYANTYLWASQMTTNNFQPGWLSNMKLSSLFHMWVNIQTRTPPILNIERGATTDKSEYTCKNMYAEMYKNLWQEYERKNDLQIYNSREEEIKTVLDSAELPFVKSVEKDNTFQLKKLAATQKNEFLSKSIDKKAMYEDADVSLKEFVELEMFGQALRDYVTTLKWLVRKMKDIPITD